MLPEPVPSPHWLFTPPITTGIGSAEVNAVTNKKNRRGTFSFFKRQGTPSEKPRPPRSSSFESPLPTTISKAQHSSSSLTVPQSCDHPIFYSPTSADDDNFINKNSPHSSQFDFSRSSSSDLRSEIRPALEGEVKEVNSSGKTIFSPVGLFVSNSSLLRTPSSLSLRTDIVSSRQDVDITSRGVLHRRRVSLIPGFRISGKDVTKDAPYPTSSATKPEAELENKRVLPATGEFLTTLTPKFQILSTETTDEYLARIAQEIPVQLIPKVLSQQGGAGSCEVFRHFMGMYDFSQVPLDIAMRQFLAQSILPTETQQIDRMMEAFANRYQACNPHEWKSSDAPYVLSFSMLLLSTDHFNAKNKTKMSKHDYLRNTVTQEEISSSYLEYLYDQITLSPFLFPHSDDSLNQVSFFKPILSRSELYGHITDGSYLQNSISLTNMIQITSSSFSGIVTDQSYHLHASFAHAPVLLLSPTSTVRPATTSGIPFAITPSNMSYVQSTRARVDEKVTQLKIAKVGTLARKDDLLENGRKASSRKWKEWTVILTGSQLIFFKDPSVAKLIHESSDSSMSRQPNGFKTEGTNRFTLDFPFRPDAVISLVDSFALFGQTPARHRDVFRLVVGSGRQYLFQAQDATDLNSWVSHINYASSFKTSGIRIRGNGRAETIKSFDALNSPLQSSPLSVSRSLFASSSTTSFSRLPHVSKSRLDSLEAKAAEFSRQINSEEIRLEQSLCEVRRLNILTPFRNSTREKLYTALEALEKQLQTCRLNIAKFECYRSVLDGELAQMRATESIPELQKEPTTQEVDISDTSSMFLTCSEHGEDEEKT